MSLAHTTLGHLQLSRNLRLRGPLGNSTVVSQITRPAEGDGINIMQWRIGTPARQPGRKLTLDGSNTGGLGRFTVGQIRAIEAIQAVGQPVRLEHHVWSGMVLITTVAVNTATPDYADWDDDKRIDAHIELIEV